MEKILKKSISREIKNTLAFRFIYYLIVGLSAPATAIFLNEVERGFYFTFVSIVGVYSILDLGLGQTLLIIFSREQSKLINSNSVRNILYATRAYYKYLSMIFILASIIIGNYFFSNFGEDSVNWRGPWILTSLSTGILLLNSAKLVFLEASGKLAEVALMRTKQTIFANIILLLLLFLNFNLWSFAIYQLILALFSSYFIYFDKASIVYRRGRNLKQKPNFKQTYKLWKKDIFPLQWKISINYVCGIIVFQLITPFIFSNMGPAKAGLIGLTINITNAIIVLSNSFIAASIPKISSFIENDNEISAYKMFLSLTKKSIIFGTFLLAIGLFISSNFFLKFPQIFLPPTAVSLIILSAICHILIFNIATYFRTYKEEPLIAHSILSAFLHVIVYLNMNIFSLEILFLLIFGINFLITILTFKTFNLFKKNRIKLF